MKVVLRSNVEIIKDQMGFFTELPCKEISALVGNFEQASDVVTRYIEKNNILSSCFTGGKVFDFNGNHVATIFYNGNIKIESEEN